MRLNKSLPQYWRGLRFLKFYFLILLLLLPSSAAWSQEDAEPTTNEEAQAEQPAAEAAPEVTKEEKPKEKPKVAPSEGMQEVDELEGELNQLKEEVFRSKARSSLLQEFLSNTEVEVYFKNKASEDFELVRALYLLDNEEIFKKEYEAGSAFG